MITKSKLEELFAAVESRSKKASIEASDAEQVASAKKSAATKAYGDIGRFRSFMQVAEELGLITEG